MSLQTFIANHRDELIKRTRAKVAKRPSPQPSQNELEHGVPLFLSQLARELDDEERADSDHEGKTGPRPERRMNEEIAETSALHGMELHAFGFTIDQVVHDYGDVCQAVTELAIEQNAQVTTAEFHTLNRCLDNAIAGAVSSWSKELEQSRREGSSQPRDGELLSLVDTAIASFDAVHTGRVGVGGATAILLGRSLNRIRARLRGDAKPETN